MSFCTAQTSFTEYTPQAYYYSYYSYCASQGYYTYTCYTYNYYYGQYYAYNCGAYGCIGGTVINTNIYNKTNRTIQCANGYNYQSQSCCDYENSGNNFLYALYGLIPFVALVAFIVWCCRNNKAIKQRRLVAETAI